jgi:hypothetical protein
MYEGPKKQAHLSKVVAGNNTWGQLIRVDMTEKKSKGTYSYFTAHREMQYWFDFTFKRKPSMDVLMKVRDMLQQIQFEAK